MDFGFLASANSITSKYFDQTAAGRISSVNSELDADTRKKIGEEFEAAYDSMVSTKALSENMRQSYEAAHKDSFMDHATRLGYSIDNRVIDMLNIKLSDDMNSKVNSALNSAMDDIANSL